MPHRPESAKRRLWTRGELLKTLVLYYQLPFGKMDSRTQAVIELASLIGRTPSAVALKLVNFASLDPELRGRGVGGMSNSSATDRSIWNEFYGEWETLAGIASGSGMPTDHAVADDFAFPLIPPTGPTEVIAQVMLRRGQGFFRAAVLAAYDAKCCITGIASKDLLRASHIIPWSHNTTLRLDPRNGLCLNALHDAAFDRGLITLSERFELKVSKQLQREIPSAIYRQMFESRIDVPITMPERFKPTDEMMEFHRTKVFRN